MQDFVPMSLKEESEKVKRPRIKLDQGSSKRVKISRNLRSKPLQIQQFKGSKGVSEEELKGMMQLVPLEEVYIKALHVKHPIIDWEIHTEGKREYWKIIRLGVYKRQGEGALGRAKEKLYDTCGVHHVSTKKNQEIFIDDRQREAFPTVSSLDAGQDRENIAKTSALPHESSPRVTSLDADEGSMQQRIHELMELCTSLQRQQSQMAAKIKDQDLEISGLKARVKSLEDKEIRSAKPTQEDAPITRGIMEIGEELGADKSTELGSNDTKEMVNVLSSMEATNILTSGGVAASVSLASGVSAVSVPTVSGSFPTVSVIFTTASVLARDSKIARLHAEEELKMMIEGEKIELISELVKYQNHHTKILKYQAQQSKPLSKKEQREFYMSVLRSHAGWKTKHFRGMTLEQLKEKFTPVWKQFEDFVPMYSKEESERVKKQGLKIDQGSYKRMKTSKNVSEGVSEEELKGMMQLVPLEEVYVEALQRGSTSAMDFGKETFSIRQATKDKEKELFIILQTVLDEELIEASSPVQTSGSSNTFLLAVAFFFREDAFNHPAALEYLQSCRSSEQVH
nr:hypothetical protein [Tanacetum cinerariifolium]